MGAELFIKRGQDYHHPWRKAGCDSEKNSREELSVPEIKAVDTLGAGDVFHGAFCFARFNKGLDTRLSVLFASGIAAFSCLGRTPHWWSKDEAIDWLRQKEEFADAI